MGTVVIVVGVVVTLMIFWWIGTYNSIKISNNKIKEALSGIDVALTKRYDTLTKMLDVTKGFQKHEEKLLTDIVKFRTGMNMKELQVADGEMDKLTKEINVLAENYPELRSSETFVELQKSIADVEEHLQAARRMYNANVTSYNNKIIVFPNSLIAGLMGATEESLYVAEDIKKQDVKMEF